MANPPNNSEIPSVSWSESPEHGEGPAELPQVKDYEIIKKLGEGGMDIVYLAEQKQPIKQMREL